MAERNAENFERGIAAYNTGDVEGLLELMDPDVEWYPPPIVGRGRAYYRGHAGIREALAFIEGAFDEAHVQIADIRDLGDRLVASGTLRMRQKGEEEAIVVPFGYLAELDEGGIVTCVRTYLDADSALTDAGL